MPAHPALFAHGLTSNAAFCPCHYAVAVGVGAFEHGKRASGHLRQRQNAIIITVHPVKTVGAMSRARLEWCQLLGRQTRPHIAVFHDHVAAAYPAMLAMPRSRCIALSEADFAIAVRIQSGMPVGLTRRVPGFGFTAINCSAAIRIGSGKAFGNPAFHLFARHRFARMGLTGMTSAMMAGDSRNSEQRCCQSKSRQTECQRTIHKTNSC